MASSDQETPDRRSPAETDPVDCAAASPWASVLEEILGVVLGFLPCLADRAAVRSVSGHWRAAARGQSGLPPPLPLLVLPGFRFFNFSPHGTLVAMRRAWMPEELAHGDAGCVGSSEGWLLVARPCEDAAAGQECFSERFLVNAFSQDRVRLPRLRAPYCTTSGEFSWTADDDPESMYPTSLHHVVLSAPPGSATKCVVAGFSYRRFVPELGIDSAGMHGLTLWQPGMKEWYLHYSEGVSWFSDLVFYQGKLYALDRNYPWLHAFTLGEDEHGVNVSRVVEDRFLFDHNHHPAHWMPRYNLVEWRGRLVVIIRYVNSDISFSDVQKVEVFVLDLSMKPCGTTEISSFEGDCVFVDPCRCTSFSAGSYEGVEGDCIYFVDKYKSRDGPFYVTTVYNMRDRTVKPFTAELLSGNPSEDKLADAVWMFPSQ